MPEDTDPVVACPRCGAVLVVSDGEPHRIVHPAESLTRFVAERCVVGPRLRLNTADLIQTYNEWCSENAVEPIESGKRIGDTLIALYPIRRTRANGVRYYSGIFLKAMSS